MRRSKKRRIRRGRSLRERECRAAAVSNDPPPPGGWYGWCFRITRSMVGRVDPENSEITTPKPTTRVALYHYLCACFHAQHGLRTRDAAKSGLANGWARKQMKNAHLAVPRTELPDPERSAMRVG